MPSRRRRQSLELMVYEGIYIMLRFTENNEVIRDDAYSAILVGLQTDEDISYSMEELKGLAEAANVEVLGQMIQNLERPNTATLIGKNWRKWCGIWKRIRSFLTMS